jgi:deoxyribodipyrimidine photo-lyase
VEAAILLFTRDLRTRDNPALAAAAGAERVVPLFVVDDHLGSAHASSANRARFLVECLADLRESLRSSGADLVVRRGDPVREAIALARSCNARAIHLSNDVSAFATQRLRRLRQAADRERIEVHVHPGVTVVPPGDIAPANGDHFKVFTPYHRAWQKRRRRDLAPTPRHLTLPDGISVGRLPSGATIATGRPSPRLPTGGETAARKLYRSWRDAGLSGYAGSHDDLAGDATSRLSPYLHFGCVSPLELAIDASERAGGEAFVRQLCWRDFHHQVVAAFPAMGADDYRPRGDRWRSDEDELTAWKEGRTGYPIVDAGMRQLAAEGWMHNRARLITASFLVKDLYADWRCGARHFFDLLVDGDVANNNGNWQWVAGTGNDTRPNRVFNPLRQAERFDPDGAYVRRYVPELASVTGGAVHRPWTLPDRERRALDYPEPVVDHDAAAARFRSARG